MDLATVPAAPPTRKNQRATSWPAPISAMVPYFLLSRLSARAFCRVPVGSVSIAPIVRDHPRERNPESSRRQLSGEAGGAGELARDEMRVEAALVQELAMSAGLGHAP